MLTVRDIFFTDFGANKDMHYVSLDFVCDCSLFGVDVPEGATAETYMMVNLYTKAVSVWYTFSDREWRTVEAELSDGEKAVFLLAAEMYIHRKTGLTLKDYYLSCDRNSS